LYPFKSKDQPGFTCKPINYVYDNEGRLLKTVDGNGNETRMEYTQSVPGCSSCSGGGGSAQPSKTVFPTFERDYAYDKRGRKTMETDLPGAGESVGTAFAYDPSGNLTQKTDKEGLTEFGGHHTYLLAREKWGRIFTIDKLTERNPIPFESWEFQT
jgi:uncharacterized protein RhaS with RHS repeats